MVSMISKRIIDEKVIHKVLKHRESFFSREKIAE